MLKNRTCDKKVKKVFRFKIIYYNIVALLSGSLAGVTSHADLTKAESPRTGVKFIGLCISRSTH